MRRAANAANLGFVMRSPFGSWLTATLALPACGANISEVQDPDNPGSTNVRAGMLRLNPEGKASMETP
jgi:hypothetical protein